MKTKKKKLLTEYLIGNCGLLIYCIAHFPGMAVLLPPVAVQYGSSARLILPLPLEGWKGGEKEMYDQLPVEFVPLTIYIRHNIPFENVLRKIRLSG